jgi:hypothetical protein
MRRAFFSLILVVVGCHGSNSSGSGDDANGGDDGGIPPNGVALTITNPPTTPAMFTFVVGYQDGDGAWTVAPAPTNHTYQLPITSDHYGVAYTCAVTGANVTNATVSLGYFHTSEQPSLTVSLPARCTDPPPAPVKLSGTIMNPPANGGQLVVAVGNRTGIVTRGNGATTYTLMIEPGTYDLFALHTGGIVGGGAGTVDDIVVARGVAITADTTHDIDFATAVAPQSFDVTIAQQQGSQVQYSTTLTAAGPTTVALDTQVAGGGGGGMPMYKALSLAAADMVATDLYTERIVVASTGSTSSQTSFTATPAALTYTAPAAFTGAMATVPATTPYPEVAVTWPGYTNAIGYAVELRQGCVAQANCTTWSAIVSASYAGASPKFQMPDLSMLAGWDAKLQLVTGRAVAGQVAAETSTAGAKDLAAPAPTPGSTRTSASQAFTAMP